jgi:RHS repeat-associated protein
MPHKFTGKRLDSSTGLYYYGARYYDPELGRFTQADTIVQAPSDPQTLNRYTYCRNNPLIYTDPTGHSFWKKFGKILRQWVAPIAAAVVFVFTGNVAAAAATYSYYATTGANLERGRGFFESTGRGALAAGATLAGAHIGGAIGGGYGTFWAGFGSAVGAGAAGGASSAGLSGGNPLLGAAAGAAAGAVGGLLGGIGGSLKGLAAIARSGAVGAASGAASGAIFGDAGGGAWRGAASAIAVAIASASFQAAIDAARARAGTQGDAAVSAEVFRVQQAKESRLLLEGALKDFDKQYWKMEGIKTAMTVVKSIEIAPNRSELQIVQFGKAYGRHLVFKAGEKLFRDIEYSQRESLIGSYSHQDGPITIPDGSAIDSSS